MVNIILPQVNYIMMANETLALTYKRVHMRGDHLHFPVHMFEIGDVVACVNVNGFVLNEGFIKTSNGWRNPAHPDEVVDTLHIRQYLSTHDYCWALIN